MSPANIHDSTIFINVIESISDYLEDYILEQIVAVYADKGYDSKIIRNYLKSKNIIPCIPKRNFKTNNNQINNQNKYSKTRFVV